MGTYCFDQYDHPLLWCKEKKKLIERKNAEESIKLWNMKKNEELTRIEKDKQEHNEMFIKYCPWGRPGGGAPNLNIRMHDITTQGLHPVTKCTMKSPKLPPCSVQVPCGKIAQIRSAIDRVYITLKDRPSASKGNKGQVDIELRYKSSPKNKKVQLERVVVKEPTPKPKSKEKKHGKEDTRVISSRSSAMKPWRAPTAAAGNSFMRSLGCTNKEILKELDQEAPLNLTDQKKSINLRQSPSKMETKRCCALCTCKCPSIVVTTESPSKLTKSKKSPKKKQNNNLMEKSDIGNSNNGTSICPRAIRDMNMDYYISNKECKPKEIYKREKFINPRDYMISNQKSEFVPLLTKRRGIHRPVSLCTTDVTRHMDQNNRFTQYGVEYLNDLDRQIKQKRRRYIMNKELEQELCNEHFRTFDTFWGRPGHGAPTSIKTKLNLDDLLYGKPIGFGC